MVKGNVLVGSEEVATAATKDCRHYWIIESPNGSISRGKCKFCGVIKEFYNSDPNYIGVWRRTSQPAQSPSKNTCEEEDGVEAESEEMTDAPEEVAVDSLVEV